MVILAILMLVLQADWLSRFKMPLFEIVFKSGRILIVFAESLAAVYREYSDILSVNEIVIK